MSEEEPTIPTGRSMNVPKDRWKQLFERVPNALTLNKIID